MSRRVPARRPCPPDVWTLFPFALFSFLHKRRILTDCPRECNGGGIHGRLMRGEFRRRLAREPICERVSEPVRIAGAEGGLLDRPGITQDGADGSRPLSRGFTMDRKRLQVRADRAFELYRRTDPDLYKCRIDLMDPPVLAFYFRNPEAAHRFLAARLADKVNAKIAASRPTVVTILQ